METLLVIGSIIGTIMYTWVQIRRLSFLEKRRNVGRYKCGLYIIAVIGAIGGFYWKKISVCTVYIVVAIILISYYYISYNIKGISALMQTSEFIFPLLTITGVVHGIIAIIVGISVYESREEVQMLAMLLTFLGGSLFTWRVWGKYTLEEIKDLFEDIGSIKFLCYVQGSLNLLLLVSTYAYEVRRSMWFVYYQTWANAAFLIMYYVIVKYIIDIKAKMHLENELIIKEDQIKGHIKNYFKQKKYILEVRRFKHDYVDMLQTLSALLNKGEIEKCKDILKVMGEEQEEVSTIYKEYSNNLLIHLIIANREEEAQEQGIDLDISIIWDEQILIEEMDICRIFINLIKNAMEACEKVGNEDKKYIYIETQVHNPNWHIIKIRNSFDGMVKKRKDRLETLKDDKANHGLGLKMIEETLEKYGGYINSSIDGKEFITIICIPK